MSLEVRFSDQARGDLVELWEYLAEYSTKTADERLQRIVTTGLSFSDTPELGRRREELRTGLRSFPVGNYLIFYRVGSERIDILRILHGARNLEDLFGPDSDETFDEES